MNFFSSFSYQDQISCSKLISLVCFSDQIVWYYQSIPNLTFMFSIVSQADQFTGGHRAMVKLKQLKLGANTIVIWASRVRKVFNPIFIYIKNSCQGCSSIGEYIPSNLQSFSCSIPCNMHASILSGEAACLFLAAKTQNNHSENYII